MTKATVKQLQDQKRALELEADIARLNADIHHWNESADRRLLEAWGDLIDPQEWLQDDPTFGRPMAPISQIGDRDQGKSRPVFESETQLAAIRGQSRLLADVNPTSIGVFKNLTNYVIGRGFSYRAMPREHATPPDALVGLVQQVIDEFNEDNHWAGDLERELFVRSRRDGEFFLALFARPGGRVQVRVIEPDQITEPDNPRGLEEWLDIALPSSWSFGIHTDWDDVQSLHGYHVRWNHSGTDWDYLPADMVEHVKLNVDRNVKRGVPDLYPVLNHLARAEKLLKNTAEGAALQAAIAWIREHVPGTTHSDVQALPQSTAVTSYPQQTRSGPRTRYVTKYGSGTILDVNHGMQYKPGPMGAQRAPNFILVHQAVLRHIGARWCMPEYMVSGDASNANFASTLAAESPFVKNAEAEQQFYKSSFRRVLWKVLKSAYESGRFQNHVPDFTALKQLIKLQIDAPQVATRDMLKQAQTNEIEHRNRVISRETWAAESGRDYPIERDRLAHEANMS